MKKSWEKPIMEMLDVQSTERDIAGRGAPDGLYESRENQVPCGWINEDCCS